MKALVTGADGQLGRAIAADVPIGWMVVALSRAALDLSDLASIARVVASHAPDLVINAAAYTAVDRAESDEAAAMRVNGEAPGALAEAARRAGAHFVQVSTDFVFDGASNRPYLPDDARNPLSVYGRTKAAGEDAVGPEATVLRTSWVHAATGANFVHTMLRLMRDREEVRVVCDQIGAPTWATGLARVAWGLGTMRAAGTWHHCDAGVASWYDFAVAIYEEATALGLLDRPVRVVPIATADYPTTAQRPSFSLLDCKRTREVLGMEAVHWRQNLRTMLSEVSELRASAR